MIMELNTSCLGTDEGPNEYSPHKENDWETTTVELKAMPAFTSSTNVLIQWHN